MSDRPSHSAGGVDLTAWRPDAARLGVQLFSDGLRIIAASQGKVLEPETVQAYWLALAQVEPADFRMGVPIALQREKFMTPAALFQACEDAREMREQDSACWAPEDEERSRAFHAEEKALRAEAGGWTLPPADPADLRRRLLVLLRLRRQLSAHYLVRYAEVSGTVSELVLIVGHCAFFSGIESLLSRIATEVAGHPVRVTVRGALTGVAS